MKLDFSALEDALIDLANYHLPPAGADGIFDRLCQILRASQRLRRLADPDDAVVLIRHVLRREAQQGSRFVSLRVPVTDGWPSAAHWARYGVRLHSERDGLGLIDAHPWEPNWLSQADKPVFEDVFAEHNVRQNWTRPIDPFLGEASGFSEYVSPGQREAVRSALLLPPGETLIVGLPTGSGKSFVAQAPVLARGLEGGLTLCVVPTTALVLDQARQMTQLLKLRFPGKAVHNLAWHSSLSAESRDAIKTAIREGRQGVLYCSPEAVAGALLPALYDAARANLLAYLVVDEAHLVSQWGDGFRPAFQMLAGVRRGLLSACPTTPFRTILMSATLAPETIETIDALYGPSKSVNLVAAVYLRPEPQYWVHREDNPEDKRRKVLEALRHAPRPFILYVTKQEDAKIWLSVLKAQGYNRLACFHGATPHAERVAIIDQWAENKLDGVVATSAFGVGIDKRDVRTVLHATVPETVDRFYQEVGRGGRDGSRSASLLIYSDADLELARSIASPSLISDDLAFERWQAMFDQSTQLDEIGLLHEIDLSTVPERLRQQSDYNQAWNMRTLIMMARAKMLQLDSQSPQRFAELEAQSGGAFDVLGEEEWSEYFRHTVVRISSLDHREKGAFTEAIANERSRAVGASNANQKLLHQLLSGTEEFSILLDRLYRNHSPGRTIVVSRACGGCPVDRAHGEAERVYAEPVALGIVGESRFDRKLWTERFPHLDLNQPILLLSSRPLDDGTTYSVFEAMVSTFGIKELCIPSKYRQRERRLGTLHRRAPEGMLFFQNLEEERRQPSAYQLPRVTMSDVSLDPFLFDLARPVHVILASNTAPDPFHPLRRLGDTGTNILTIDQFQRGAKF
ncbi:DEAD/DEAH box helicase [Rhizobium leguminosarum]|uniref:protein DpdF n=1 Tax=Rhizobium leguminosarum TaxID=384 RepID=UPI0013B74A10|nr:DEAD/DEAH box helicase [Rhizobium leguminosarum]NEI88287.1 DEAD/DEAH box helicase [Rhizobium leguminosarum]